MKPDHVVTWLRRRRLSEAGATRLVITLVLLALGGWIALADATAPFGRLSWLTHDAVQPLVAPAPRHDPRIVIVDIDDTALARHGRWPWPRERLASLVEAVQAAKPAMVGLDILLPEPGAPEADRRLARVLAADNLVTATAFADLQSKPSGEPALAGRELAPSESLRQEEDGPALGHITPLLEADGRIRRLYPRICVDGGETCRTTLSLAMLERWTGMSPQSTPTFGGHRLCVASFCQWLDARGRLMIPYHHPARFDYLGAAEVMNGKYRELLAGRMVLVGTSAAGLGDLVATPRGALTPGVELHATLLAAWLDSHAWRVWPYPRGWTLAGLVMLALVALPRSRGRLVRRFHSAAQVAVVAALGLGPVLLATKGWWLDPWAGWLGMILTTMIWLIGQRWRFWRRHRHLYRTFGAYVPRSILRGLAEGDGEASFAPQRRRLVILFSDIRGFTALSDTLSPERLTLLTNHVFSELTEVVHQHGGTLDKYIGDAMMAFWGAPVTQPDDSQRAMDCAMAFHLRLVKINNWCKKNKFPPIAMNIGMEAGEVTVGNLGSRQRRSYTAMGQAVNLASRLEEYAANWGLPIAVGPELAKDLKSVVSMETVHLVEFKGVRGVVSVSVPMVPQFASDSDCMSSPET